jgi:hypothetical protein
VGYGGRQECVWRPSEGEQAPALRDHGPAVRAGRERCPHAVAGLLVDPLLLRLAGGGGRRRRFYLLLRSRSKSFETWTTDTRCTDTRCTDTR